MVKQIVEAHNRAERQQRRAALGTLKSLVIQPNTFLRYRRAFTLFLQYLAQQRASIAPTRQELDHQVENYLEHLWQDGESLSLAGDTLSGIQHFQPNCKRHLPGSWRLFKAWQLRELPARAPPFTITTLQVLLGCLHAKSPSVALGVYLAFRCLLRTGELLALQAKDIVIPPGPPALFFTSGSPKRASAILTPARSTSLTSPWPTVFDSGSLKSHRIPPSSPGQLPSSAPNSNLPSRRLALPPSTSNRTRYAAAARQTFGSLPTTTAS